MNVRATAKFVGTSSRKVGSAAELIRGQKAQNAVTVLAQAPQRATGPVGKVLASAIANAENNYNLSARNLVVESVLIGPGPTLKRFRPRAQGRAYPIRKRTSHITVVLSDAAAKEKAVVADLKVADSKVAASAKSVVAAELTPSSDSPRTQAKPKTTKSNKEAK